MHAAARRLSPPPVALTGEIRWVLARAFGPSQQLFPGRVDGPLAARLAGDLGLVERIGARVPSSHLVAELGREMALQLAMSRLEVLARVRGLCELIPELAAVVAGAGIPIVFLKFAALHVGGYLAEGSRAAGDIDVLLPEREAARAAQLLVTRGSRVAEVMRADHHLPPLQDSRGRLVELHTQVPGLRVPGAHRFARFETLEAAGGLEPASGLAGCYLLRREPMIAHLVAHGLAHHGGADAYPVTRVLADVIDLLPADRKTSGTRALEWLADDVPASELEAVLRLCDALEKGDVDGLDGREAALLRHVLAGILDPAYRSSLALTQALHPLTDEPRWWKVLKTMGRAAFPTEAQLAMRAGSPDASRISRRVRLAYAVAWASRARGLARGALRVAWRRMRPGAPG